MMREYFEGKTVLVTGGTGSIGSEVVRQVFKFGPKAIRVLSNDEDAQFNLAQEFGIKGKVRFLFGDIREEKRVRLSMEDVDIVFHAAAMKHVPTCEFNPFEAVKTNVIGTQNVMKEALAGDVKKVITISTDKAVNPINVMGATKLLAERLTISAHHYRGNKSTVFSCVRFGNVLASRGSVIPIFMKQISQGGPLTITNPKMTRFIMHIHQSVGLILKAAMIARGGEIFILKMPALTVGDLAEAMIEKYASRFGHVPEKIKTEVVGMRPGEKFHEELMTHMEAQNAAERDGMYVINDLLDHEKNGLDKKEYISAHVPVLSKAEISSNLDDLVHI
ncbi:MAG: UDP-N-acetylglucosamine 4,6-dehydratase family protein [Candidatus Margulisiibacteriota bacterium]